METVSGSSFPTKLYSEARKIARRRHLSNARPELKDYCKRKRKRETDLKN